MHLNLTSLPRLALFWYLALSAACTIGGGSPERIDQPHEPGNPTPGSSDPRPGSSTTNMRAGGDTGSIGAVECFTAQACRAAAQDRIDALSAPVVVNWQLLGSECVARDEDDPDTCCFDRSAACFCFYDWSGDTVRRRENALIIGGRPVCDEWSRGLECLSPAEEFDGCDPKDPASCEAACSELDQRLSDDRARTFDAEIRFAACENYHCRVVTRVEDCCYAVFVPGRPGYDCSLSDAEILQMAYGESGPSCPASMCDAGASVALPADDADGGV